MSVAAGLLTGLADSALVTASDGLSMLDAGRAPEVAGGGLRRLDPLKPRKAERAADTAKDRADGEGGARSHGRTTNSRYAAQAAKPVEMA